jgi:hypothetical protein
MALSSYLELRTIDEAHETSNSEYPEVRVRFPTLPDFQRSSGPGTGPTQHREYS